MKSLAGSLPLGALLLITSGISASNARAQVPETVLVAPPPGYGPNTVIVVEAPAPPPGYDGVVVLPSAQATAAYSAPAAPPREDQLGLRILAETGGYFLGAAATVGLAIAMWSGSDLERGGDPTLFLLTTLASVLILPPLGTWLGGNAVDGHGELGWTILGNALFGIFGSVLAYELSHSSVSSPRSVYGSREADAQRRAQGGGLGFTLAF